MSDFKYGNLVVKCHQCGGEELIETMVVEGRAIYLFNKTESFVKLHCPKCNIDMSMKINEVTDKDAIATFEAEQKEQEATEGSNERPMADLTDSAEGELVDVEPVDDGPVDGIPDSQPEDELDEEDSINNALNDALRETVFEKVKTKKTDTGKEPVEVNVEDAILNDSKTSNI